MGGVDKFTLPGLKGALPILKSSGLRADEGANYRLGNAVSSSVRV